MKYWITLLLIQFYLNGQSQNLKCLESLSDTIKQYCAESMETKCNGYDLGTIMLYEDSRLYSNVFCDSLRSKITFVNKDGVEVYLNVNGFYHAMLTGSYNMMYRCIEDRNKFSWYCLNREIIRIDFSISNFKENFKLEIYPAPEYRHPHPDKVGDYIEISHEDWNYTIHQDCYAIINIGTQDYGAFDNQVSKRRIKILGEVFKNVFTIRHVQTERTKFQFVISKTEGIVAFVDLEGETWRVKYRLPLED